MHVIYHAIYQAAVLDYHAVCVHTRPPRGPHEELQGHDATDSVVSYSLTVCSRLLLTLVWQASCCTGT